MSYVKAAMKGVPVTLQPLLSVSGNGTAIAIPSSFREHIVVIKGSAGVSAGAVQVETADAADYAGTWAPLGGAAVTVVASKELVVNLTGIYPFLRARISTPITDGTVSVTYEGS